VDIPDQRRLGTASGVNNTLLQIGISVGIAVYGAVLGDGVPTSADPRLRTGLQSSKPTHALGTMIECYTLGVPFKITGVDWDTRDGTAIRDYIHVWDIARAFSEAAARFDSIIPPVGDHSRYEVVNLGTGDGTTVRELVAAFREVVGDAFVAEDAPARPGDVVGAFVDPAKAWDLLAWKPEYTIEDAIRHSLQWAERRRELDVA
jgi:UDP-glucose 4-epimerase